VDADPDVAYEVDTATSKGLRPSGARRRPRPSRLVPVASDNGHGPMTVAAGTCEADLESTQTLALGRRRAGALGRCTHRAAVDAAAPAPSAADGEASPLAFDDPSMSWHRDDDPFADLGPVDEQPPAEPNPGRPRPLRLTWRLRTTTRHPRHRQRLRGSGVGTAVHAPPPRRDGRPQRRSLDGVVNLWSVVSSSPSASWSRRSLRSASRAADQRHHDGRHRPRHRDMQVIVKQGGEITKLDLQNGAVVEGVGTLLGSFYTLADGTVVYVPSGSTPPGGTAPTARPPRRRRRPRRPCRHNRLPHDQSVPGRHADAHAGPVYHTQAGWHCRTAVSCGARRGGRPRAASKDDQCPTNAVGRRYARALPCS